MWNFLLNIGVEFFKYFISELIRRKNVGFLLEDDEDKGVLLRGKNIWLGEKIVVIKYLVYKSIWKIWRVK